MAANEYKLRNGKSRIDFIRPEYRLIYEKPELGIEIWGDDGHMVGFHGRAQKPDWHYRLRNTAEGELLIERHLNEYEDLAAGRERHKAEAIKREKEDAWKIYTEKDRQTLIDLGTKAGDIWYATWKSGGAKDFGACCVGICIRVLFRGKRERYARHISIADCNFAQGNLAAASSVTPALAFLASNGIEASYHDGRMD